MAEVSLDRFDRKILRILQEDGRISIIDLAEKVGLSATPCTRRVKRLEELGVIQKYEAIINPDVVGLGISVFVRVRLEKDSLEAVDAFVNAVKQRPEITECYLVTGTYDYLLRVRMKDVPSLRTFILNELVAIPSVAETSTHLMLEETKRTSTVPVDLL